MGSEDDGFATEPISDNDDEIMIRLDNDENVCVADFASKVLMEFNFRLRRMIFSVDCRDDVWI